MKYIFSTNPRYFFDEFFFRARDLVLNLYVLTKIDEKNVVLSPYKKNVNNFCRFRKVDYFCFTIFGKMADFI